MQDLLRRFFDAYEARFAAAMAEPSVIDAEEAAGAFADIFVEATPVGVSGGKNDAAFRELIPKCYAFYKSIGTTSMRIDALGLTKLDPFHWMAKVHWKSAYRTSSGSESSIDFDVIYFVQTLADPKIFAYITGDEQNELREHGLVPQS